MPSLKNVWWDALRPRRDAIYSNWSRRLQGGGYLAAIAALAIGYRLLVWLIYQFPLPNNLPAYPIWPPAAYSQLILLLLGLKFWPAVALGSLFNTILSEGQTVWMTGIIAAINNTLQAALGAWLLLRTGFSPRIDRLRDVGLLITLGGVLPATVSATIGILNCCLSLVSDMQSLSTIWWNWWLGNVSSVLILFPAVLTLPEWPKQLQTRPQQLVGLPWLASLALLSWFVFAAPDRTIIAPYPLEYLPFPLIVWGALRLGPPGAAASILLTTGFACWGFIQNHGPFFHFSARPEQAILALQAYICVLVITALALAASMVEREQARMELQAEKEKSEQLLLNILPQPIATRLKQHESTIADHFAEVTVLFADIVDFTRLSTELSPQALVIMLNEIFSIFDALADKHGLEKIKTIGDAYMVVGGLPEHRDDHAAAIAEMALDMQRAVANFSRQYERPFTMRIGINTGPVVAGVIGTKKFIYDLWGDTVNIASRMESSGIAGEIQVTEATYKALTASYQFDARGEIAVKGKGMMETYLLRDRRPLAAS
ncbi:MAG: MASE1 domain-containing protein [Leptolyngbya sp. SIO1E4]|nr:MASE1 domain-containing protein [Leptolyngbya sp. SIO1E4]